MSRPGPLSVDGSLRLELPGAVCEVEGAGAELRLFAPSVRALWRLRPARVSRTARALLARSGIAILVVLNSRPIVRLVPGRRPTILWGSFFNRKRLMPPSFRSGMSSR